MESRTRVVPSRSRLALPLAFAFALVVIGFIVGGLLVRRALSSSFDAAERVAGARGVLFLVIKGQLDEETSVRGFSVSRDPTMLQPYEETRPQMARLFATLGDDLTGLGLTQAADAAADASRSNTAWQRTVAQPLLARAAAGAEATQRRGKALVDRFRADAKIVDGALTDAAAQTASSTQAAIESIGFIIAFGTSLLFAAGLAFAAYWIDALGREQAHLREMERSQQDMDLAQLTSEKDKRLTGDLQAAIVQHELPVLSAMRFSAKYVPATDQARVGGDWYVVLELDPHRVFFAIGDVAGHGIDAAIAMVHVRRFVFAAAVLRLEPASVLAYVNREMFAVGSLPMVTASVGIADSDTRVVEYACAGHPPPALVEPGSQPRLLEPGSVPLGIRQAVDYRTRRISCAAGSMLVLFTDGITERSHDVLEGEKDLLAALERFDERDYDDAAAALHAKVFGESAASDDVAIVTIRFATRADAASGPRTAHIIGFPDPSPAAAPASAREEQG